MHFKRIFLAFSFLISGLIFVAQEESNGFFIRPTFGIIGSQVDGDNYSFYKKPGIYAGSFIGRNFSEQWTGSFGLAFCQKGAWQNANPNNGNYVTYHLNINYIDVPLQVTRKFKAIDLTAGITYSQFINYKETSTLAPTNLYNNFHSFDLGWMLGVEKQLANKWYFGFRFNYSLLPMRDFFYSPSQPQLVYYNIWGKLFNRGFYNNMIMFYFTKEINPNKKSEPR